LLPPYGIFSFSAFNLRSNSCFHVRSIILLLGGTDHGETSPFWPIPPLCSPHSQKLYVDSFSTSTPEKNLLSLADYDTYWLWTNSMEMELRVTVKLSLWLVSERRIHLFGQERFPLMAFEYSPSAHPSYGCPAPPAALENTETRMNTATLSGCSFFFFLRISAILSPMPDASKTGECLQSENCEVARSRDFALSE